MAWMYVIIAGVLEIVGLYLLKKYTESKNKLYILALTISFATGFSLLSLAFQQIPMGTAYAVWTGIGTAGGAAMGILFFKESKSVKRLLFLTCIIVGVIGLKLIEG